MTLRTFQKLISSTEFVQLYVFYRICLCNWHPGGHPQLKLFQTGQFYIILKNPRLDYIKKYFIFIFYDLVVVLVVQLLFYILSSFIFVSFIFTSVSSLGQCHKCLLCVNIWHGYFVSQKNNGNTVIDILQLCYFYQQQNMKAIHHLQQENMEVINILL